MAIKDNRTSKTNVSARKQNSNIGCRCFTMIIIKPSGKRKKGEKVICPKCAD